MTLYLISALFCCLNSIIAFKGALWVLTILLEVFNISCCFVCKLHLNIASLQSPTHKFLNTRGKRDFSCL